MKQTISFILLAALFACNNSASNQQKDTITVVDSVIVSNFKDPKATDSYTETSDAQSGSAAYNYLTVTDYKIDDKDYTAVAMLTTSGKPVRIYLSVERLPNGKSKYATYADRWFYIDTITNKVLFLREVLISDSTQNIVENRFYYDTDQQLVKNVSFRSENKPGSSQQEIPYKPLSEANDYTRNSGTVNTIANTIIERMKADFPGMSANANNARRQGATLWAVGNEPGWNLIVYPNRQIVFINNYGNDTLYFPYAPPQRGPKDATINTSNADQHQLKIFAVQKDCTDDAGMKSPLTVTIQLDDKTFSGCGKMLN
ncbi:hypothetical protein LX64_03109 [Chitinophaga skermanii]|uniref:NlpE-like protein n=1 Tax=Chitinophaga skermanii TaxID=331697 RepID=A0A327QIP3_9BACT|nr:hypothetical protein [Chitinophaga skermanii]RAJ04230.1 hypothetical protein LX64_03109 [Chitinophaga skermanii]